jgi:hypothetical protein
MIRLHRCSCSPLVWGVVLLRMLCPGLCAEDRGVQVVFKMDAKVVKGPDSIIIEAGDRSAVVEVRNDVPAFDASLPPHTSVVVLPDWAVSVDPGVRVSLTAKFKRRTLHFQDVKLWPGMGRLSFLVDRPPLDDDVDYALGESRNQAAEAHALFLEGVEGDGRVMAHVARTKRKR